MVRKTSLANTRRSCLDEEVSTQLVSHSSESVPTRDDLNYGLQVINSNNDHDHSQSSVDEQLDQIIDNSHPSEEEVTQEIRQIEEFLFDNHRLGQGLETETLTSLVPISRPLVTLDEELNDIDLNRIEELIKAFNESLNISNSTKKFYIDIKTESDYFQLFSHSINGRDHIESDELLQTSDQVWEICMDDQIALFKYGCWQMAAYVA